MHFYNNYGIQELISNTLGIPSEYIYVCNDYVNPSREESDELFKILDSSQNILRYKTYNLTISSRDLRKIMVVIVALHDDGYAYIEAILIYARAKIKSTKDYMTRVINDIRAYNEYVDSEQNRTDS